MKQNKILYYLIKEKKGKGGMPFYSIYGLFQCNANAKKWYNINLALGWNPCPMSHMFFLS